MTCFTRDSPWFGSLPEELAADSYQSEAVLAPKGPKPPSPRSPQTGLGFIGFPLPNPARCCRLEAYSCSLEIYTATEALKCMRIVDTDRLWTAREEGRGAEC